MKKIYSLLAIAVLALGAGNAMAQNLNETTTLWGQTITATNGSTQGSDIALARDGSGIYILGSGAVKSESDQILYGTQAVTPGTIQDSNSGSNSLFFVKTDKDGKLLWAVNSTDGDFTANSCYLAPTADGGAVLYLLARHTLSKQDRPVTIVDANGRATSFDEWGLVDGSNVYGAIVAKVSTDGAIEWTRLITADTTPATGKTALTTQAIWTGGLAVDKAGNVFITGRNVRNLYLGDVVVPFHNDNDNPANGGSIFLIKFDANGNYAAHLTTGGEATKEAPLALSFKNGKLYLLALVNGIAGTDVTLGSASVTAANANAAITVASLNPDLSVNYLKYYACSLTGSALQTPFIDEINGTLWIAGKAKMAVDQLNVTTGSLARAALLLKGDAATGELTAGRAGTTAQEGDFSVLVNENNQPYIFSHVLNKPLKVERLNAETLETEDQAELYSSSSDVQGVAADGNNVYLMFRNKNAGASIDNAFSNAALANFSCFVAGYKLPEKVSTAINSVRAEGEASLTVYGGNGVANIVADKAQTVEIYSVSGACVARVNASEGFNTIALPQGVYIAAGSKIIVR